MDLIKYFRSDDSGRRLLSIYINHIYDLETIQKLQTICKSVYETTKSRFALFYSIPYLSYEEKISKQQLEFLVANSRYLKFHSSWFVSLSIHGCVDLVPLEKDNNIQIKCCNLQCPPECKRSLSLIEYMFLIDERLNTRGVDFTSQTKLFKRMMEVVNIYHILPLVLVRSIIPEIGYNHILEDQYLTFESYMLLYNFKDVNNRMHSKYETIIGKINYATKTKINNVLPAIGAINLLLQHRTNKSITESLRALGNSICIPDPILNIYFIKHEQSLIQIHTHHYTYIAVGDFGYSAYIITYCIRFISLLSKIAIVCPEVLMIGMASAIFKLPPGISSDLSNLYERVGNIKSFAIHFVVSYLFGINSSLIMVKSNAIVNLLYNNLYETEWIKIANIISELGGRKSELYQDFKNKCYELYIELRRYFRYAVLFLDMIGIPRHKVISRFQPRLNDEKALDFFRAELKKSEDWSLGIWTYAGY